MFNFDMLGDMDEEMWVLPLFMNAGKNDTIIRTPKIAEVELKIKQGLDV